MLGPVNQPSTPPLAEIPEKEASGAIAEVYTALRRTSGAAIVPLIYRHLATYPGGMEWMWRVMGPFMESGELPARAGRVVAMAVTADLPGLAKAVAALNLGADDIAGVVRVLDLYNRTNPINIIAVKLARFALGGQPPEPAAPETETPPASSPL